MFQILVDAKQLQYLVVISTVQFYSQTVRHCFLEEIVKAKQIYSDLDRRKATAIACGGFHSAILLEDGMIVLFGNNHCGQTDVPNLGGRRVIAISCGFL